MKKHISFMFILLCIACLCSIHALAENAVLTLPASTKHIEAEAFRGDTGIGEVILPNGVEDIGSLAFAGSSLTSINLPASIGYIADDSFDGCRFIASVHTGSYAHDWCVSTGASFKLIEEEIEFLYRIADDQVHLYGCNSLPDDGVLAIPPVIDGMPVVAIDEFGFNNYEGLTGVILPADVTSIGMYAFGDCADLASITVDAGNTAYKSEDGVLFTKGGDTLILYPPAKSNAVYTVPAGVASIGRTAFSDCAKLTAVFLPDSVTSLGHFAFCRCDALEGVTFPAGIEISEEDSCIFACPNLIATVPADSAIHTWCVDNEITVKLIYAESPAEDFKYGEREDGLVITSYTGSDALVVIPESIEGSPVTGISFSAFWDADTVTGVHIPSTVVSIDADAFDCPNLTDIIVDAGNSTYADLGGVLFTSDYEALVTYPGGRDAKSYSIPAGVTIIREGAFGGCDALESIDFPAGLVTIGNSAFSGCSSLATLNLPDTLEKIGFMSFAGCDSLTSVTIPGSLETVTSSAFSGCEKLAHVEFCEGVETVEGAFYECPSLSTVILPSTVHTFDAFDYPYCDQLTAFSVAEGNEYYAAPDGVLYDVQNNALLVYPSARAGDSYSIPEGTLSIESSGFGNCCNLRALSLPASLQSISESVFYSDISIESFAVDDGNASFAVKDGALYSKNLNTLLRYPSGSSAASFSVDAAVHTIHDHAFAYADQLSSVTLPDGLARIGDGAFLKCSALTSVNIPETVRVIDGNAFSGCSTLTAIDLPEAMDQIGSCAFYDCASLESIEIPEGIHALGSLLFSGCTSLKSISVPESVEVISSGAIEDWTKITMWVHAGSHAHDWCVENSVAFELIKESNPTEHTWELFHTQSADCNQAGLEIYKCIICGAENVVETEAALGHSRETVNIAASCIAPAATAEICARCGAVFSTEESGEPIEHNYISYTQQANCLENALEITSCTLCGHVSERIDTGVSGSHKWVTETREPSCGAPGGEYRVCTFCQGAELVQQTEEPLAHEWNIFNRPASCQQPAGLYEECQYCGILNAVSTEGEPVPHSYEQTYHPAVCFRGAYIDQRCIYNCDEYSVLYESPLTGDHKWQILSTPATCTEPTTYRELCKYCGLFNSAWTEGAALGHSWQMKQLSAASCTSAAKYEESCLNCGESSTFTMGAALGHKWTAISDTLQQCSLCGAMQQVSA